MSDKLIRDENRLPDSSAEPKYVYNKVKQTVSGHRFEIDDTPGKERIFEGHKSGTYKEISSDGKLVDVVVGNRHQYTKATHTVTIDGFQDVICQGNKLVVKGGSLIEVVGQYDLVIAGDANIIVSGNIKATCDSAAISAKNDFSIRAKNINLQAENDINLISSSTIVNAENSVEVNSGKIEMVSGGEYNVKGYTVSLAGLTYIGQSSLGDTDGSYIVTIAGPSSTAKAKV